MTFERGGIVFNLLDTPGHSDFSEDTYRTLTAVDAAVMVIDAAKGIESQTRKLFEVCRLRDIPIVTFINKIDREARRPAALLDEIAAGLALDLVPMTWPVGMGDRFPRLLDLLRKRMLLPEGERDERRSGAPSRSMRSTTSRRDAGIDERIAARRSKRSNWRAARCRSSTFSRSCEGHLTPVFFGSALQQLRRRAVARRASRAWAPAPLPRKARERTVEPDEHAGHGLRVQGAGQHGPATTATASRSCGCARASSGAA